MREEEAFINALLRSLVPSRIDCLPQHLLQLPETPKCVLLYYCTQKEKVLEDIAEIHHSYNEADVYKNMCV